MKKESGTYLEVLSILILGTIRRLYNTRSQVWLFLHDQSAMEGRKSTCLAGF